MNTLLDVIDGAEKNGTDSYNAPHCPNCGRGEDRLVIWPNSGETGRVYCRNCDWGRSTHPEGSVDGIEYMRRVEDMSFRQACEFFGVEKEVSGDGAPSNGTENTEDAGSGRAELNVRSRPEDTSGVSWSSYDPPGETWREAAEAFCMECKDRLWNGGRAAESALNYLHNRGLSNETIEAAGLGVNDSDRYPPRKDWGLEGDGKVWLPRGVVIPWADSGGVSGVNIRRPKGDIKPGANEQWKRRKYQRAPGPSAPLYGVQWIYESRPIVLVEGEFDALAVQEVAGDICFPVGTGSTGGARRQKWRDMLADAPAVLVSFDDERPGEEAARAWIESLPNGIRWPPHADDAGEMLEQGKDLRMWVRCGIQAARKMIY